MSDGSGAIAPVDIEALWAKVRQSSFYAAMRTMPQREREAMFAIYAFCRAVDDIADDQQGDRAARTRALNAWRADLDRLYAGADPGVAAFLAEAVRGFQLERADFEAIIDGMQMDVDGDIVAPDDATLDLYCDRVASAVGRLSVKVFGMDSQPGIDLAYHLGRALQLTNIVRDLDEDAAIGRLYVSSGALAVAQIPAADPRTILADPRIDVAARQIACEAKRHYEAADKVMKTAKGQLKAPRLMGAAYGRILKHMLVQGWKPPRRRVSLTKREKLWVLARYGLMP
ncbi:MAG: presqualene diphosphate synthase HpnD [Caulobacteraceae bacterium]